ncbi:ATP-binding protein [Clostridium botulinum]
MKENKISTGSTKDFIIEATIGNLNLETAILNLIDNSIQAAGRLIEKYKGIKKYTINVLINVSNFMIEDNCGGISKEQFKSIFKFNANKNCNVKRSVLKLGKKIIIKSNSLYTIPIDVNTWGNKDDWDIYFKEEQIRDYFYNGVSIEIKDLYREVIKQFVSDKFLNKLVDKISKKYRYKLKENINLLINNKPIYPKCINENMLEASENKSINGVNVTVNLYNIHTKLSTKVENGWDFIINGICVIKRDKSLVWRGKGKVIEKGHSYVNFIGEVLIEGNYVRNLPIWVDKNSEINAQNFNNKDILDFMNEVIQKNRNPFKSDETNIQYRRPYFMVEKLKDYYYNAKTSKDVGEDSFDEAYTRCILNKKSF